MGMEAVAWAWRLWHGHGGCGMGLRGQGTVIRRISLEIVVEVTHVRACSRAGSEMDQIEPTHDLTTMYIPCYIHEGPSGGKCTCEHCTPPPT